MADLEARRAAAWPCAVVVLRDHGVRLPAADLLQLAPASGLLVCEQGRGSDRWNARLYQAPECVQDLIAPLWDAQLERERAGVRLYGGLEADGETGRRWRQSWLCTPTPARAGEILAVMARRETGGQD